MFVPGALFGINIVVAIPIDAVLIAFMDIITNIIEVSGGIFSRHSVIHVEIVFYYVAVSISLYSFLLPSPRVARVSRKSDIITDSIEKENVSSYFSQRTSYTC